jgi:hypothetical protein
MDWRQFNKLGKKIFKELRDMPPKAKAGNVQFNAPGCPQLGHDRDSSSNPAGHGQLARFLLN